MIVTARPTKVVSPLRLASVAKSLGDDAGVVWSMQSASRQLGVWLVEGSRSEAMLVEKELQWLEQMTQAMHFCNQSLVCFVCYGAAR